MPFGIKTISGYLTALSQIHHGGDHKTGSETLFRTQEYFIEDKDMYVDIPIIHGNALRGIWRRIIMNDLTKFLNLEYEGNNHENEQFTIAKDIYHALFSGGTFKEVAEKDSGKVYIKFKQEIRELLPPISLLGTAYGNQPIPGKFQVSHLIPVCSEMKAYLPEVPEKYKNRLNHSAFEFRDFMFQTRKDELREERKEGEQAVQMLIKYEVMKPGTVFYTELKLIDYTELELSCLARIIELWSANPRIGGKSAVGLGKLKPEFDCDISSKKYTDFLEENKQRIIDFLDEL
ncbi:MAG: RAMP superfamily CRISPR-associated protein [Promethearchaeia archaeon]